MQPFFVSYSLVFSFVRYSFFNIRSIYNDVMKKREGGPKFAHFNIATKTT
jgi:hypothetical protein